jgi:uncharacterized phage-associated protein
MIVFHLNPLKATQVAAYFIKSNGKHINYTKMIKLMYLADREALKKWNRPITGGSYVSMVNGPVLSEVYDWIRGKTENKYWLCSIKKDGFNTVLVQDPGDGELSEAEIKLLNEIDKKFKKYTFGAMIDYCHTHIKEWEDPSGSSLPIANEKLLSFIGKEPKEIKKIEQEISDFHFAHAVFGS